MSYDYTSNRLIPQGDAYLRMLDNTGPRSFVKIYCACGKIVDLDKKAMSVKKSLRKELECTACRNARISKDIDIYNSFLDEEKSLEESAFY